MIKVSGISKTFKLYSKPSDRLKEIFFRKNHHKIHNALKNISFEVSDGETLGIIGPNGAGKSTLLKIITGVLLPEKGLINIDGKITGLLELGTGFNPEMTGLQNIYMSGALLGMSKHEIQQKEQEIIDFTELGDFINEPIKTYSSGMVMRLAFSCAIHADPQVFVVDEALSVGDAYFQQKCMRKIIDFKNNGGSIIFVSHDMNAVKVLCDSAILLDNGNVIDYNIPKKIIDFYQGMILKKSHLGDVEVKLKKIERINKRNVQSHTTSTGEVVLVDFQLLNDDGDEISYIENEATLIVKFKIKSCKNLSDPHYGIIVRNKFGQSIFETNTYCMGISNTPLKKDKIISVMFKIKCNLAPADYSLSIGVANKGQGVGDFEEYLLLMHDVEQIKVIQNNSSILWGGIFNMDPEFSLG
jgi:ABC-type polysaccharide/polyol phosphate transport system ATPase subunit